MKNKPSKLDVEKLQREIDLDRINRSSSYSRAETMARPMATPILKPVSVNDQFNAFDWSK